MKNKSDETRDGWIEQPLFMPGNCTQNWMGQDTFKPQSFIHPDVLSRRSSIVGYRLLDLESAYLMS
jgi:hypothetical protein